MRIIINKSESVNGLGSITDNGLFVYPRNQDLTASEIQNFIDYHREKLAYKYRKDYKMYIGDHDILHAKKRGGNRPDNHIVINYAGYAVDMFSGYFDGIPAKLSLTNSSENDKFQNWQNMTSFSELLYELSKQADIYGRSYMFVYQDEESQTQLAVSKPSESFMIYDDSIQHKPVAFIRYSYDDQFVLHTDIYLNDGSYHSDGAVSLSDKTVNPFKAVPAVEFIENEERLGIVGQIASQNNALDKAISQKANQNEYFDNAYLFIRGMQLPEDDKGNVEMNLDGNQIIYAPASENGEAKFLTKPDGDVMQENHINRLTNTIFQIAKVANLNDESFSGNSSGVALKYKLLAMQNAAINKERKFTQSLRKLFKIVFDVGTILPVSRVDAWQDLAFQFTRNLPVNLADEAETAKTLDGIVSKETQLKTLSVVDDPKQEIETMDKEKKAEVDNAVKNSNADYLNSGDSDDQEKE